MGQRVFNGRWLYASFQLDFQWCVFQSANASAISIGIPICYQFRLCQVDHLQPVYVRANISPLMSDSFSTPHTKLGSPDLLDPDASVLTLLPALALGLASRRPYIDDVYRFLDSHARDPTARGLVRIRRLLERAAPSAKPVYTVHIDPEKAVLLAYTFGKMYSEALALADGGIEARVVAATDEAAERAVETYLEGHMPEAPVLVRVLARPSARRAGADDAAHVYLRARAMIERLGLQLDLERLEVYGGEEGANREEENNGSSGGSATSGSTTGGSTTSGSTTSGSTTSENTGSGVCGEGPPVRPPNENLGERVDKPENMKTSKAKVLNQETPTADPFTDSLTVNTDIRYWYCSCRNFTRAAARPHTVAPAALAARTQGVLARAVAHGCRHPAPLPVCVHLVALVLAAHNRPALPVRVRRVIRSHDM